MASLPKNNLPVWKRDGSWANQKCFNILNPLPPHTHQVGKQFCFSRTVLASYRIKYYTIKYYSLHWNILRWELEILWQWLSTLILTANLVCHNTDPKEAKNNYRFRKDTFIPNKQTCKHVTYTGLTQQTTGFQRMSGTVDRTYLRVVSFLFLSNPKPLPETRRCQGHHSYQTKHESCTDTRLIVIVSLIVTKVNYFTTVTITVMSALVRDSYYLFCRIILTWVSV